eukprot:scpid96002/ scgid18390/ 
MSAVCWLSMNQSVCLRLEWLGTLAAASNMSSRKCHQFSSTAADVSVSAQYVCTVQPSFVDTRCYTTSVCLVNGVDGQQCTSNANELIAGSHEGRTSSHGYALTTKTLHATQQPHIGNTANRPGVSPSS